MNRIKKDRKYNAWLIEEQALAVTCPNCGDPAVPILLADLDGLHCGMTVMCPLCCSDIVLGVFTPDEYHEMKGILLLWHFWRFSLMVGTSSADKAGGLWFVVRLRNDQ